MNKNSNFLFLSRLHKVPSLQWFSMPFYDLGFTISLSGGCQPSHLIEFELRPSKASGGPRSHGALPGWGGGAVAGCFPRQGSMLSTYHLSDLNDASTPDPQRPTAPHQLPAAGGATVFPPRPLILLTSAHCLWRVWNPPRMYPNTLAKYHHHQIILHLCPEHS